MTGSGPIAAACAFVDYGQALGPRDLLDVPLEDVFTVAELRHLRARHRVDSWAGRVAAKRAVADVLRATPDHGHEIEILPEPAGRCTDARRCRMGHPVGVRLAGALAARVAPGRVVSVSISHGDGRAVALAVLA